jgi:hypothetical protein
LLNSFFPFFPVSERLLLLAKGALGDLIFAYKNAVSTENFAKAFSTASNLITFKIIKEAGVSDFDQYYLKKEVLSANILCTDNQEYLNANLATKKGQVALAETIELVARRIGVEIE